MRTVKPGCVQREYPIAVPNIGGFAALYSPEIVAKMRKDAADGPVTRQPPPSPHPAFLGFLVYSGDCAVINTRFCQNGLTSNL